MKRSFLFLLSVFVLAIIMVAVAIYVPNALPVGSDFSAIYYTDLALVHGIHIYDIPNMEKLALKFSNIPAEHFFMPRFPYPPWYALSTFYLGLLSIQSAGTLWFELNFVMLFLAIWFLTDGWSGRLRLIAFPLGLFFLPVIGTLSIGQYDFPVLLGTSLLIYALRKESIALTTAGAVLLTFKPHIGALILLSVLGYLIASRNKLAIPKEYRDAVRSIEGFGQRAVRSIIVAGVILFTIGFVADPTWPLSYPNMLLHYQGEGNVAACSECASVPVFLSRWIFDGSLAKAALIALVALIVLVSIFYWIRSTLLKSPELFLNTALLITLLVSPYLYNYDFILLLIPFAILVKRSDLTQKIVVIVCYLVPTFVIISYGRAGNISLLIVAAVMALLLFLNAKSKVDVRTVTAYNTNN